MFKTTDDRLTMDETLFNAVRCHCSVKSAANGTFKVSSLINVRMNAVAEFRLFD
ncbi:MAG: hypothetical protein ITG00_02535 [Flavobacterium sp.]|nr:hypothetical protein [Flavobacterium sp.]